MNVIRPKKRNGFTLVEVAVVLFFMGIFVSFAASMMKNIALSNKLRDARDKLTVVSDAVQSWANKNRRLPTNPLGPENFETVLSQPRDYWNKKYAFYPYTTTGVVRDFCRMKNTTLAVCQSGDCTNKVIKDVAYVLVSGGENLIVQTPAYVTSTASCSGLRCMPLNEVSQTYDDIYKYVTLIELKKSAGCVEADSGLRILNPELPSARLNNKYVIPVVADGGQNNLIDPKYSWCVQGIPPTGLSIVDKIGGNVVSCSSSYTSATFINISGVPNASALGTATPLTFKVKDSVGVVSTKAFVLNVNP